MFEKVVPVSLERHRGKRVRPVNDLRFAANLHLAYLTVHEFARAAGTYPIVFLEDKASDQFRPLALLGLEAGENLFVDAQGRWEAAYIPAIIRRYPFGLSRAEEADRYVVCVDEGSELLSDTEGLPLFDEQGQPTDVIENVKRYLGELQQMEQLTNEFVQFIVQHNLLTPLNMRVSASGQARTISGCYVINEERLNNLSDARFLEIRQKGYLPALYAHLISLSQTERLVALKDRRAAGPAPSPVEQSSAVESESHARAPRGRRGRASGGDPEVA